MATKRKEPESQRISWFLYSFERPLLCMSAKRYSIAGRISAASCSSHSCSIRKKFERGEVMITTFRFLGYDKNEYGDLIVNRKEAEIVSLTFDLYLLNVGSSRIGELLDYLDVKTVTGTTWERGTINLNPR